MKVIESGGPLSIPKPHDGGFWGICGKSVSGLWCILLCLFALPGFAHEGEDHGAAAPVAAQASAVTSSHTEQFEVVARWQGDVLEIALADDASNAPIVGASVQLQMGKRLVDAAASAQAGIYQAKLPVPLPDKVVLMISVGDIGDLIPLDLPALPVASAEPKHTHLPWLKIAAVALLLCIVVGALYWRQRRALLVLATLLLGLRAAPLWAHAGEPHDEPAPQSATATPLTGDTLTLTKAEQFKAGLLTARASAAQVRPLIRLNAQVLVPPSAQAQLTVPEGTQVHFATKLYPGMAVRAGQALFQLKQAMAPAERLAAQMTINQAQGELRLLEDQYQRASRLDGIVPAQEIERLRLALERQREALRLSQSALQGNSQTLFAPISGVLENLSVTDGQIVASGTVVAELIQAHTRWVEANAFEHQPLPAKITQAWFQPQPQRWIALRHIATSQRLDPQTRALHLRFALPDNDTLAIGTAGSVAIAGTAQNGVQIPKSALHMRQGQAQVLVLTAPERLAWRTVTLAAPLPGDMLGVISGVEAGERVVAAGFDKLGERP